MCVTFLGVQLKVWSKDDVSTLCLKFLRKQGRACTCKLQKQVGNMGPDAGPNFVCLKLGIQFLRHAGIPESRCDQNDHRRAEKVLGANKGHWEFRSFMEGPKLAFGDTKDAESSRPLERSREKGKKGEGYSYNLLKMFVKCLRPPLSLISCHAKNHTRTHTNTQITYCRDCWRYYTGMDQLLSPITTPQFRYHQQQLQVGGESLLSGQQGCSCSPLPLHPVIASTEIEGM